MVRCFLLILFIGLTVDVFADDPSLEIDSPKQMVPKAVRDPKTGIIYYLESNRHHLSAISPKGIILWQIDTWDNLVSDKKEETIDQIKNDRLINFIDLFDYKNPRGAFGVGKLYMTNNHLTDHDGYLEMAENDDSYFLVKKSDGSQIFFLRN